MNKDLFEENSKLKSINENQLDEIVRLKADIVKRNGKIKEYSEDLNNLEGENYVFQF